MIMATKCVVEDWAAARISLRLTAGRVVSSGAAFYIEVHTFAGPVTSGGPYVAAYPSELTVTLAAPDGALTQHTLAQLGPQSGVGHYSVHVDRPRPGRWRIHVVAIVAGAQAIADASFISKEAA